MAILIRDKVLQFFLKIKQTPQQNVLGVLFLTMMISSNYYSNTTTTTTTFILLRLLRTKTATIIIELKSNSIPLEYAPRSVRRLG
jgi:hypothetical protein